MGGRWRERGEGDGGYRVRDGRERGEVGGRWRE